jgi:hypothetical protein
LIGLNKNNTKNLNITNILDDEIGLVDKPEQIAGPSSESLDNYLPNKGKNIVKPSLTSASLDNLNSTAQQS